MLMQRLSDSLVALSVPAVPLTGNFFYRLLGSRVPGCQDARTLGILVLCCSIGGKSARPSKADWARQAEHRRVTSSDSFKSCSMVLCFTVLNVEPKSVTKMPFPFAFPFVSYSFLFPFCCLSSLVFSPAQCNPRIICACRGAVL